VVFAVVMRYLFSVVGSWLVLVGVVVALKSGGVLVV
jgi:hypothetical protein